MRHAKWTGGRSNFNSRWETKLQDEHFRQLETVAPEVSTKRKGGKGITTPKQGRAELGTAWQARQSTGKRFRLWEECG